MRPLFVSLVTNYYQIQSKHPSQTISAYSKDERTKDFNETSSTQRLKLYFDGLIKKVQPLEPL